MAGLINRDIDKGIPLKNLKMEEFNSPSLKKQKMDTHEDSGFQIGGGNKFVCPICHKRYARKWTLQRHIETDHKPKEAEESADESDSETDKVDKENEESDDDSDFSEESEPLSDKNIDCLLHMVGAAELGKLGLTTAALRCFISKDEKEESLEEDIEPSCLRMLKEMLLATKEKDFNLTEDLYIDVLNAIDEAAKGNDE
jgi:hypothetical protein